LPSRFDRVAASGHALGPLAGNRPERPRRRRPLGARIGHVEHVDPSALEPADGGRWKRIDVAPLSRARSARQATPGRPTLHEHLRRANRVQYCRGRIWAVGFEQLPRRRGMEMQGAARAPTRTSRGGGTMQSMGCVVAKRRGIRGSARRCNTTRLELYPHTLGGLPIATAMGSDIGASILGLQRLHCRASITRRLSRAAC
jgi:hypothetical protein